MSFQASVLETIADIDLSAAGCPSLVMRDLSEFATLPFLAAFDVPAIPKTQTPPKRITYIALAKKVMPMLVDLFLRFKEREEIFVDGTIEAVLSVCLFIPLVQMILIHVCRRTRSPSS
jgi:hypothetical protein